MERYIDESVLLGEDKGDGYKPNQSMMKAAKQGLDLRSEHGRGGTEVGIARGRDIMNGKTLPLDTVKRIHQYFTRHAADKNSDDWDKPSNGKIAWLLWGGDAGAEWAKSIVDNLDETLNEETVSWSWGDGKASGKVVKRYKESVTKTIKGTEVTKNGTDDNPAVEIEQEDGTTVLKLQSELDG